MNGCGAALAMNRITDDADWMDEHRLDCGAALAILSSADEHKRTQLFFAYAHSPTWVRAMIIFLQNNFQNVKKILKRAKRRTPKFFVQVRNIGVAAAAVSAAILASPVALPAVLIKVAGYLAVAGAVAGSVSQTAVTNERN